MKRHEAIALSAYESTGLYTQQTVARSVMRTIGCATEIVDGFDQAVQSNSIMVDPFPFHYYVSNSMQGGKRNPPKSDWMQLNTHSYINGLKMKLYSRFTAMACLNGTRAGNDCKHRTSVLCMNSYDILNIISTNPDPAALLEIKGGCYQLAMEWSSGFWTNVMPHEISKAVNANTTSRADTIPNTLTQLQTPSYEDIVTIVTESFALENMEPCVEGNAYLGRDQSVANLQALQTTNGTARNSSNFHMWKLLSVPSKDELGQILQARVCQYIAATKSNLEVCSLNTAQIDEIIKSMRPTGKFCFMPSSDAYSLQAAVIQGSQTLVGSVAESSLFSSINSLQSNAVNIYPPTSYAELLLAISAAILGILTCNKTEVKVSIARHSATLAKIIPI